jgi:phosphoribosylanthranilate isomerase
MKIKVCGLKNPENIKAVTALSPNYVGFIFYAKSPRFAKDLPVEALAGIPNGINKVAVFVDETEQNIRNIIHKYDFDFIQLHGNETPAFCKSLRDEAIVIKAFGVDKDFDFEQLNRYKNKVDMFLFDAKTVQHGGSGQTFDWDLLDKYELDIPFFISGGLSPDNIEEVAGITHPQFYGLDLNSKFETEPGIKDIEKLKTAFKSIKPANEDELRS